MIAIAGGKGGCGKTTTTLGLAEASARHQDRNAETPLAIDADWDMPNLHALADVPREPGLDDVMAGAEPSDGFLPGEKTRTTAPGCRIVPAPVNPSRDRRRRRQLFQQLSEHCRTTEVGAETFLDCPAGAGPDAVAPLSIATGTVLVTEATPTALADTQKTAAMSRTVGTGILGVILTRADGDEVTRIQTDIRRFFGAPLLGSIPAHRPPILERDAVRAEYDRVVDMLSNFVREGPQKTDRRHRSINEFGEGISHASNMVASDIRPTGVRQVVEDQPETSVN